MGRPKVVFVLGSPRPHEIMLLILSPIFGVDMMIGDSGQALDLVGVPHWEVHAFAVVLCASGAVGLLGVILHTRADWWEVGMRLEGGALTLGAGGLLLFTYVIGTATNWRGTAALFLAAWTLANAWRALQCVQEIRRTRE